MRSSSADAARTAPRLADRAGWVRLGAAVLLGLVAAAAPLVGQTSAQFTDTGEVALGTVGTPDEFAPTPGPTDGATPGGTSGSTTSPGAGPAAGGSDGTTAEPSGPSAGPDRHGPGRDGPDRSGPQHQPPRIPCAR